MVELNKRTTIKAEIDDKVIKIMDDDIFLYPFIFTTGHGNIKFKDGEIRRLRSYLLGGGFLYVDDNYSLDKRSKDLAEISQKRLS